MSQEKIKDNGIDEEEDLPKYLKDRIEKNRQKALARKNSKLCQHHYAKPEVVSIDKNHTIKIGTTKYKDTGGGFLLEEKTDEPDNNEIPVLSEPEAAIIDPDRPMCFHCNKPFATSWLFDNFGFKCCNQCKEENNYKLITKTEAKSKYLLQDCDFSKREPPLKYIEKKNPHNVHWGMMKLFLELQVEERALEVWGSTEKLEEERESREDKKVVSKVNKYNKQMKQLRMSMRSSLYDRTSGAAHEHEFGPESYNEEDDTYTKKCVSCAFEQTYEKM